MQEMVIGREKDNNISKVGFQSDFGDKKVLSDGSNLNGDYLGSDSNLATELELFGLLQNQRARNGFNISRSGSAPPTVEGAVRAFGSLNNDANIALVEKEGSFSKKAFTEEAEEGVRSHPAYFSYYYSNDKSNPRLPPPFLSRENWRAAQRVQGRGSTMEDRGKWMTKDLVNNDNGSSSLFAMQPRILMQKADTQPTEMRKNSTESLASLGVSQKSGMGGRRKSFADIVQEGLGQTSNSHGHLPQKPSSHNSLSRVLDTADTLKPSSIDSENKEALEAIHNPQQVSGFSRGLALPKFVSAAGSSSTKIKTSEHHQTLRTPPGFPVVQQGHVSQDGEENITHANRDTLTGKTPVSDISTSFPRLSLLNDQLNGSTLLQSELEMGLSNVHLQNMQQQFSISRADKYASPHIGFSWENGVAPDVNYINFDRHVNLPRRTSPSVNLGSLANSSEFLVLPDPKIKYQGSHLSGYSLNGQSQRISGSLSHSDLHSIDTQPDVLLEQSAIYALQAAAILRNLSQERNFNGTSYDTVDLQDLERVYFEALLLGQQRQQVPFNYQYHDKKCIHSATIPRVQFQSERCSPFPTFKGQMSGSSGSSNMASGSTVEGKLSLSLLEELKNNKTKSLELLDVLDHFVEFSMDQFGSRFIQQKLEISTIEDKMKIFPWVLPHVRGLMTDVFGNYVIQKFFEHGTEIQRKELADQLLGHVLPLSLQMYGCRVIQKALEVVDLEQQILMVAELDGSVMKCVHDQNGNHVIQKCIECIPQDKIKFIISSFFGQVVTLSTHPYGCRVIQRVLEHCKDPNTQQIIMDEVMKSVRILAQDQYGNYVIQHVLQHGKPDEKTEIIVKLSGQIVKMSQQKFASNVVEKCLTYGSPEQRKMLIDEMLGSTDDNEAFQAMMKDPFGNYVVQKVLETCDDECRELIISRIKVHLNALKRYTYGKHIVSRVEKLIETGERHSRGGVKA